MYSVVAQQHQDGSQGTKRILSRGKRLRNKSIKVSFLYSRQHGTGAYFYSRWFIKSIKSIKNMQKEVRSGPVKITVTLAASLRNKFNKLCKKQDTSAAQRLRDFIQSEVKVSKALP